MPVLGGVGRGVGRGGHMNTEHECIIGLLYQTDYVDLCTLSILENHIKERKEINRVAKKYMPEYVRPEWTIYDYADRRKSTNLTHFTFCPMCGKKINWQEIRKKNVGSLEEDV